MGYPVNSDAIGVFMQRMRFRTPLAAIDQGAAIATQDKVYRQVFVLVSLWALGRLANRNTAFAVFIVLCSFQHLQLGKLIFKALFSKEGLIMPICNGPIMKGTKLGYYKGQRHGTRALVVYNGGRRDAPRPLPLLDITPRLFHSHV